MKRTALTISLLLFFVIKIFSQESKDELLISAVLSHNVDSVRLLLEQGANPNYENIYGVSPLLFAVEEGDTVIIQILLDNGANINIVQPYDPPAVSFAVINFKIRLYVIYWIMVLILI
jgi:ankyrin repeat protein